jgi:hypothetical protein
MSRKRKPYGFPVEAKVYYLRGQRLVIKRPRRNLPNLGEMTGHRVTVYWNTETSKAATVGDVKRALSAAGIVAKKVRRNADGRGVEVVYTQNRWGLCGDLYAAGFV